MPLSPPGAAGNPGVRAPCSHPWPPLFSQRWREPRHLGFWPHLMLHSFSPRPTQDPGDQWDSEKRWDTLMRGWELGGTGLVGERDTLPRLSGAWVVWCLDGRQGGGFTLEPAAPSTVLPSCPLQSQPHLQAALVLTISSLPESVVMMAMGYPSLSASLGGRHAQPDQQGWGQPPTSMHCTQGTETLGDPD